MGFELPPGFHDSIANRRLARLRAEIERLAYSSPPEAGREARIRELKAAVSVLVQYQIGFSSIRWLASIYKTIAVNLGVGMLILLVLVRGRPFTVAEGIRGVSYVLAVVVAVGLWDFRRTRRHLRAAEALADSLGRPHTTGSARR
jgi:hypothetical protein